MFRGLGGFRVLGCSAQGFKGFGGFGVQGFTSFRGFRV